MYIQMNKRYLDNTILKFVKEAVKWRKKLMKGKKRKQNEKKSLHLKNI